MMILRWQVMSVKILDGKAGGGFKRTKAKTTEFRIAGEQS